LFLPFAPSFFVPLHIEYGNFSFMHTSLVRPVWLVCGQLVAVKVLRETGWSSSKPKFLRPAIQNRYSKNIQVLWENKL